jgi:S-DNA-T family DNA segregation ATPase FtsK/SpoIIIE
MASGSFPRAGGRNDDGRARWGGDVVLIWGAWQEALGQAAAAYRGALGRLESLGRAAPPGSDASPGPQTPDTAAVRIAARQAADAAAALPGGWFGAPWPKAPAALSPQVTGPPGTCALVRIGTVDTAPGAAVPLHIPLLGRGHLTIDVPVRDPRVAGLFQGILLRLLAGSPPGSTRVLAHDPAGLGRVFAPFRPLAAAGVLEEVGTDRESLLAALDAADARVRAGWEAGTGVRGPALILALAGFPPGTSSDIEARLAALAHAGPPAGVCLLIAGWPPARQPGHPPAAELEGAAGLRLRGERWSPTLPGVGHDLDLPVELDPAPGPELLATTCRTLAAAATAAARGSFDELLADPCWTESSSAGLSTPVGRTSAGPAILRFDDTTPHWLVGGRSGAGKTIFLLDVLAGLSVRYPPSELSLYLLDFKEGVSFTEFTPTPHDPTWIPHAVAVGIESDREYGLAVLHSLQAEMRRRATAFKRAGVTGLTALRQADPQAVLPRIVAVIDEFQVLFAGNDDTARQASTALEDLARKGRSFGVHLILASQTASGIEALQTKADAIFGQFPLRVALAGGGSVLDPLNPAADGLAVGTAVINASGGIPGANAIVRLPYADPQSLSKLRRTLWSRRPRGSRAPAVFAGFAEHHVEDDPTYATLTTGQDRRTLLVGRLVDVGSPTAAVAVDAVPGRHLAVVGTSPEGADILHAALAGLARQHRPGTARFVIAPLVQAGDGAAAAATALLTRAGHPVTEVALASLSERLAELARFADTDVTRPTYLALFGAEAAGPVLSVVNTTTFRPGTDDLRAIIQSGPVRGVHVLSWWRSLARLACDLGPSAREDIACLLALNVPGPELSGFLGRYDLRHVPRPNRGLLLDRHDDSARLVVPFVRSATEQTPTGTDSP